MQFLWIALGLISLRVNVVSTIKDLPCNFFDSINITEGNRHENGSFTFNGIEYTNGLYAEVDYIVPIAENPGKKESVDPHFRGCLCNLTTCIRLCCPPGQVSDGDTCYSNDLAKNIESMIYNGNNLSGVLLDKHFGYVHDKFCTNDGLYPLDNYSILAVSFSLFRKDLHLFTNFNSYSFRPVIFAQLMKIVTIDCAALKLSITKKTIVYNWKR